MRRVDSLDAASVVEPMIDVDVCQIIDADDADAAFW